jgi:hypothetical protein
MLFSRTVARRDAILNGFACAILAIASMVINIIVAVQNKSSAGVLEKTCILSLIILMVGLWIAVSYLKNNKVSAYICRPRGHADLWHRRWSLGIFSSIPTGITLHDNFWPVGLGYIWYIIGCDHRRSKPRRMKS